MTRLIPFKKEHLEVMDMRDHERGVLFDFYQLEVLQNSIAFTGIVDGIIVAAGGVMPFGNGNAEIWQIPSIHVHKVTKTYCKELKKKLFQIRSDLALTRMQTCAVNDELHTNWMKYLGFKNETPDGMKEYYNGLTYYHWARTWGSK